MVWSRQSVDVPYCDRADVEHVTTAVVDMAKCQACGFGFEALGSWKAHHAAVCIARGLLAPEDIVAARNRLGLTQQELAARSGCGIASIKRWESSRKFQNVSSDRALRAVLELDAGADIGTGRGEKAAKPRGGARKRKAG
jgi:DNA-binding XRE family transcriptional regulator